MRKKSKGGGEPIDTWDGIFADPEVGVVLHANGLIADANKSSIDELSQITSLSGCFIYNTVITKFPELKYCTGVTDMKQIFRGCYNLTEVGDIPNSVTDMTGTFYACSSLIKAPIIPNSVTNMSETFSGCSSLIEAPIIPNSVTNMSYTFYQCSILVEAPIIPEGVTNMSNTFYYCTSLVNAPIIPESVTDMYGTFNTCRSLVNAPIIPESVTNMGYTFSGCRSIDGIFIIKPITPPTYNRTFGFGDVNVSIIYVPNESVDSYKNASGWSDYSSKIYPMSELPE